MGSWREGSDHPISICQSFNEMCCVKPRIFDPPESLQRKDSGVQTLTSIQSSDHRKRESGARVSQGRSQSRQLIRIHQMSATQEHL